MATFFGKVDPKFVPVPDDGLVKTDAFLQAARQILPFFDLLGTAFSPVKKDIKGNIDKLQTKLDSNPEKYGNFKAMLEDEIEEEKNSKKKKDACISLLWLKRALDYISIFMSEILGDAEKKEKMVPHVTTAYEKTLKPYHGWIVQKVFGVVSMATPNRKDFIIAVASAPKDMTKEQQAEYDEQVVKDMEAYLLTLRANVEAVDSLLRELNLDSKDKV